MEFDSECDVASTIANNVTAVQRRIAEACRKQGRDASEVTVVAVTKYAQPAWVRALIPHYRDFGENRPQQLVERQAAMPDLRWHLIGQLQRNKVRSVLPATFLIHSVDSVRLLNRIEVVARELQCQASVLLQVNISGEASKSGLTSDEVRQLWKEFVPHESPVRIQGLMTMAAATQNPDDARSTFAGLYRLRSQLRDLSNDSEVLPDLSMGMSGDYEVAIEEGATIVRVGSRLFEGLDRSE